MEVEIAAREIRLTIEENSVSHKIVDNFCQKNFSNLLKLSNTFIIYHKESEVAKKKYFLSWVYTAYKKSRKNVGTAFLKSLQSNGKLPIRISIRGKNRVLYGMKVKIMFPQNNVMRLLVEAQSSVPVTYFSHIFKKSLLHARGHELDVQTTVFSLSELRKILEREKILGVPVTFIYNEKTLSQLFDKLDAKLQQRSEKTYSNNYQYRYKQSHSNHQSVFTEIENLDKSYKLLNCNRSDCQTKVKKEYLKLVKEFHPDRVYGKDEGIVSYYTKKFQEISDAYSVIQQSLGKVA